MTGIDPHAEPDEVADQDDVWSPFGTPDETEFARDDDGVTAHEESTATSRPASKLNSDVGGTLNAGSANCHPSSRRRRANPPTSTVREAGRLVRAIMASTGASAAADDASPDNRHAGPTKPTLEHRPLGSRSKGTGHAAEAAPRAAVVRTGPPRFAVLVIGLALVGLGGAYYVVPDVIPRQLTLICGASLKVGVVLVLAWLAWPQLAKLAQVLPAWLIVTTMICLITIVIQPKLAMYIGPVYLILIAIQFSGYFTKWLSGSPPKQ